MNGEDRLPLWLRHALVAVGLFLSGAILAFGYSYRPLHGAMSWRAAQLESRLDERNRENLQLSNSLAKLKSFDAARIEPETLAQVERELDQTKRVLAQAERDLKRSERKRREANSSAAKWRKRFKDLEDRPAPVAAIMPESGIYGPHETPPSSSPASLANTPPAKPPSTSSSSKQESSSLPLVDSPVADESGILPSKGATRSDLP